MLYLTYQSKGENHALYMPGVRTEAEVVKDEFHLRTFGKNGTEFRKLVFTLAEAETLSLEIYE